MSLAVRENLEIYKNFKNAETPQELKDTYQAIIEKVDTVREQVDQSWWNRTWKPYKPIHFLTGLGTGIVTIFSGMLSPLAVCAKGEGLTCVYGNVAPPVSVVLGTLCVLVGLKKAGMLLAPSEQKEHILANAKRALENGDTFIEKLNAFIEKWEEFKKDPSEIDIFPLFSELDKFYTSLQMSELRYKNWVVSRGLLCLLLMDEICKVEEAKGWQVAKDWQALKEEPFEQSASMELQKEFWRQYEMLNPSFQDYQDFFDKDRERELIDTICNTVKIAINPQNITIYNDEDLLDTPNVIKP